MLNQTLVMNKRDKYTDFSNKLEMVTILLTSQECCQVLKPEVNGMLGRPKKVRAKKMPDKNISILSIVFVDDE